ncbi:MAG: aspartate aminotransferase family protein [Sulfolobales archaeon]
MISKNRLEERLRELIGNEYRIYREKTKKSAELFEKARKFLPGGVSYVIRYFSPYPVFIKKAKDVNVWDIDGNEYVDYWMGHGTHILGHSPDFVVEAVNNIAREGTHFGYENPYVVEYAEFLAKTLPNIEQIRFSSSGTEANMYAIRIARAYTKRRYVVKFEGGWHGGLDQLHVGVSPPYNDPETLGLPQDFIKYTLVAPYNNIEYVEKLLKTYDVAAVLIEPVLGAGGCIEARRDFLRELRRLTEEYQTLLIFDEVITGFRLAYGGGQEYYEIKPDLVVYGKIIGGGYPGAGAFGGKSYIMEYLDQIKRPKGRERSGHGGTFVGNPITIVAGYTLVKYLYEHREEYERFNSLWEWARKEIDDLCESNDRICWATGVGNMLGIHFTEERPWDSRTARLKKIHEDLPKVFHVYARNRDVLYLTEDLIHLLPSMKHSKENIENLIKIFAEFLEKLRT